MNFRNSIQRFHKISSFRSRLNDKRGRASIKAYTSNQRVNKFRKMNASIYIYNQRDGARSHIGVPLYFPSITIIIGVPLPFLSMRGSTIGRPLYECHWLHKWCNLHSRVVIGQGPAARCSMHPWVYRPQNVEIGLHLLFEKYVANGSEWIRSSWNLSFNNYSNRKSGILILRMNIYLDRRI